MSFAAQLAIADVAVLEHLGEEQDVRYVASNGAVADVRGIFDEAYVKVEAGEVGYSSSGPAVFLRTAGLSSDPRTDDFRVVARGKTYKLREAMPDGMGGILLLLHWVV
ncbi:hypothetical protein MYSTI_01929 [Myxococcus stipitatus DSM 14675]|uniref:Uncharacterized protein n=1 Tax=Myxococcus stipitatus (strain DSM 14675 / JCM 12634 / Mx s8) TaxID=1278073 RepID=L7U5X5_MYXSD|nr:hypothetical protein [Myxococcus stipitatus]AGC43260.1 hypothetical protein MYSTI_01929 [Myxococcus stipitatus DSM 14675]